MQKLNKEELNKRLQELKKTAIEDNYKHTNAMCYSMAVPKYMAEFKFICEQCGKEVVSKQPVYSEKTPHNLKEINDIVNEISKMGYYTNIKYLCRDCDKEKNREQVIFEFKVSDSEEVNKFVGSNVMEFEIAKDFLNNELKYEKYQRSYTPKGVDEIVFKVLGIVSE